jgi:hypothetical protein
MTRAPAGQALGHVLGGLAPHGAGEEQAVAVLPLPPARLPCTGCQGGAPSDESR